MPNELMANGLVQGMVGKHPSRAHTWHIIDSWVNSILDKSGG